MKRILTLCIALILIIGIIPTVGFAYEPSDWAKSNVEKAMKLSIISEEFSKKDYEGQISRSDFINIAVNLYATITAENISTYPNNPFSDTTDPFPNMAYYAQFISGDGEGHFFPRNSLTRQELCKIITNLLGAARILEAYYPSENVFEGIPDADKIAPWAKDHVAFMIDNNIMAGDYETGAFRPTDFVSRQEAAVIAYRCYVAYGPNFDGQVKTSLRQHTDAKGNTIQTLVKTVTLENGATVSLANANNPNLTQAATGQTSGSGLNNGFAPSGTPLQAPDANGMYLLKTYPQTLETGEAAEKRARIFPDGLEYTSAEEAESHMSQITVNVWKVNDSGQKYASTLSFKINSVLKDDIYQIFEEIFDSPEQPPIKDANAYGWRSPMSSGSYSDHNYGTAIDLNYFENFCEYPSGITVGSFYKPGESIYSFPADGVVVQTFAKYGWLWGGNAWIGKTKDYMHFTYLGK